MKITFSSLLLAALAWGTPLQVSAAKKAATNNKFAGYLFANNEATGNPILPGFHADPEILQGIVFAIYSAELYI